jgi:hypothetical protein
MSNYQLIIKIPFSAMDDPDARLRARDIIENSEIMFQGDLPDYKLQRVYKDKSPEGIKLTL